MASRFVSAGKIDSHGDRTEENDNNNKTVTQEGEGTGRISEWEAVEKELEAERARREEQRRKAASGEEKSLYEILEANKAAKQAAFEEANKIKNQFRALDDDEIDFLDEVRDKKRKEEEQLKRETEEGLRAFREAQRGVTGGGGADGKDDNEAGGKVKADDVEDEDWGGKKRKRGGREMMGVKGVRRKVSDGDDVGKKKKEDEVGKSNSVKKTSLGLVDYGSDSDDDEDD